MKKTLLVLCTLLLASCIDVMDFGAYWAQGTVDPKLAGMWIPVAVPGTDISKSSKQHIVVKDDSYSITNFENGIEKIDAPLKARLLKIGAYDFLMVGGPTEGALYRYKQVNDVVQFFDINKIAAHKLVVTKYPNAKNIDVSGGTSGYSTTFSIKTLDEEAVKILADIPDDEAYWKIDSAYKREP